MRAFIAIVGKINLATGRLVAPLTLIITIFVLWEVLVRYFFNAPTTWSNEVNQYLLCALVMIGAGYTLKNRAHTRVDIIYINMSDARRNWIEILSGLIVLLFCSPMIYFGIKIAYEAYELGETSVSAAQLVLWPSQAMVPLGAFLLALQGLANAMESALSLAGGDEEDDS
jgi:TRAP-type mannitol/chloroaromatic compound transport system permease small subunit